MNTHPHPRFRSLVAINRCDRITDARPQFYQRLDDWRNTLPPPPIDPDRHLNSLEDSLSDPGRGCLLIGLIGLIGIFAMPVYYLFRYYA